MPWEHGTTTGYARKCRCDLCTAAHTEAARDYAARNPEKVKALNKRKAQRRLIARRFNPRQAKKRHTATVQRRQQRLYRDDSTGG